jgi:hypothetical protein
VCPKIFVSLLEEIIIQVSPRRHPCYVAGSAPQLQCQLMYNALKSYKEKVQEVV